MKNCFFKKKFNYLNLIFLNLKNRLKIKFIYKIIIIKNLTKLNGEISYIIFSC